MIFTFSYFNLTYWIIWSIADEDLARLEVTLSKAESNVVIDG